MEGGVGFYAPRFAIGARESTPHCWMRRYRCSIRTMYGCWAHGKLEGWSCVIPSTRNPNCWPKSQRVWSWDITKLMGDEWSYFYLYVILDILAEGGVGWDVSARCLAAVEDGSKNVPEVTTLGWGPMKGKNRVSVAILAYLFAQPAYTSTTIRSQKSLQNLKYHQQGFLGLGSGRGRFAGFLIGKGSPPWGGLMSGGDLVGGRVSGGGALDVV